MSAAAAAVDAPRAACAEVSAEPAAPRWRPTPAEALAISAAAVVPLAAWPGLHDSAQFPKAAALKTLVAAAAALAAFGSAPRRAAAPGWLKACASLGLCGAGAWLLRASETRAALDAAELLACAAVWTALLAAPQAQRAATRAALAAAALTAVTGLCGGGGAPSYAAAGALVVFFGGGAVARGLRLPLAALLAAAAAAASWVAFAAMAGAGAAVAAARAGLPRRARWLAAAAAAALTALLAAHAWRLGCPGGDARALWRDGGPALSCGAFACLAGLAGTASLPWAALALFLALDALGGAPLRAPSALVWFVLCAAAAARPAAARAPREPTLGRARALLVLLVALLVVARQARSFAAQRLFARAESAWAAGDAGEASALAARAQAFAGEDSALRRFRAAVDARRRL